MLPTTPTGWNTVPNRNRRTIISPDDNDQDIDYDNSNPNPNSFILLEDSDSEDDASTTSSVTSVVEPAQVNSDAAYLADPVSTLNRIVTTSSVLDSGSTDHIVTTTYQTVDISRQYLELVPTVGTQLEHTILSNQPYIDNILENFYHTVPDELPALYTSNGDDGDTASTVSISSIGSMGKELPSIDDHLGKEYQSPERSDFNFADAVVFREALGNALEGCQHTERDAGHAYLVDTLKRNCERYGDDLARLPPPAKKVALPTGDASGTWRRYEALKKIYEKETHWNAEALQATVGRFPDTMKEQMNDYGTLPLNYTARLALNFIEGKVSDRVKKQKAYIDLMGCITARAYVPSPEGPVSYLKKMEHDKHCINILSGSSNVEFEYSSDTLIINCQTKIRSSGSHNNTYLRLIEDKWEADMLHKPVIGRWKRFKQLYIKELQKLTEDGIDNSAMSVQQALIARVNAFESKYETEVQTLNNNQLTLENAFQASSVPSIVDTDGTGTVSGSISGTAASGIAFADLLREMKAMRAELTTLKSTKPGGGRGGGGGDKKAAAEARAALLNVWRQWKFWCHSCGCNLNHNSNNCTSFKKKSGHKDEATMQNPMGGNEGKNELHNKWWSPVDHKPYDKPE
jgi:hypothetical protein